VLGIRGGGFLSGFLVFLFCLGLGWWVLVCFWCVGFVFDRDLF
jgi:hypothetical protein